MKRTKLVTGIVLTALLSTSCVNEDYDLDDIDMNIGINTDLELPLINSGEVTLANFIGDDNDFLKTVTIDGQMYLKVTANDFSVFYLHEEKEEMSETVIYVFAAILAIVCIGMLAFSIKKSGCS